MVHPDKPALSAGAAKRPTQRSTSSEERNRGLRAARGTPGRLLICRSAGMHAAEQLDEPSRIVQQGTAVVCHPGCFPGKELAPFAIGVRTFNRPPDARTRSTHA